MPAFGRARPFALALSAPRAPRTTSLIIEVGCVTSRSTRLSGSRPLSLSPRGTCLSVGIFSPPPRPASLASPTPATGAGTLGASGPRSGSPSRGHSRSLPPMLEVTLFLRPGATPAAPGFRPAAPWSPWSARGRSLPRGGLPPFGLVRTSRLRPGLRPSRNPCTPRGRLFSCRPGGSGFAYQALARRCDHGAASPGRVTFAGPCQQCLRDWVGANARSPTLHCLTSSPSS